MVSNSQAEWTDLETKYRTPPVPETPHRKAICRQARGRLQRRQFARLVEAQCVAVIAAGESPNVSLTQAEHAVLARRFASPAPPEGPATRLRRHASRTRSERLLETRSTAHRLRLDHDKPTRAGSSASSYEQLAAVVLNLSSESLGNDDIAPGFPSCTQLCSALEDLGSLSPTRREDGREFPTYDQLAVALRDLTPTSEFQHDASPGFPFYAQLNAALRNLSPEMLSQMSLLWGFLLTRSWPKPCVDCHPARRARTMTHRDFRVMLSYRQRCTLSLINPALAGLLALLRFQDMRLWQPWMTLVPVERHVLPARSVRCLHCGAMKWSLEMPNACCLRGDVQLAPAFLPPSRLRELYSQRSVLDKIRGYNCTFAFTSTGAKENHTISRGNAPYTFRVNGAMHHRIGQLLPPEGANPTFAQIYVYDGSTGQEVALRGLAISSSLNLTTLGELQTILHDVNPPAAVYQSGREHANDSQEMCLALLDNPRVDPRRYNRPTAEEVAAIMIDGSPTASHRDAVLRYDRGGFRRIFETHSLYDPLQYPLIYLRGEVGWSIHTHGTWKEFGETTTPRSASRNTRHTDCT
ncbi:hypothetical protein PC128_g15643 [Phytophthora cactorum]|nr:hypothetical protein PC128_g15643 [Phytophthora cactorum]